MYVCIVACNSINPDLKPVRNPLVLFRGAEYNRYNIICIDFLCVNYSTLHYLDIYCSRFQWVMDKEPLTFFDMNLSAQEHQVIIAVNFTTSVLNMF